MEINDKSLSQLESGIRQTPLAERLEAAHRMISRMCSKGEPPRMSIPAQASDEDMYIITTLQDASAEIERLRAAIRDAVEQINMLPVSLHAEVMMRMKCRDIVAAIIPEHYP